MTALWAGGWGGGRIPPINYGRPVIVFPAGSIRYNVNSKSFPADVSRPSVFAAGQTRRLRGQKEPGGGRGRRLARNSPILEIIDPVRPVRCRRPSAASSSRRFPISVIFARFYSVSTRFSCLDSAFKLNRY